MNYTLLILMSIPAVLSLGFFSRRFKEVTVASGVITVAISLYILLTGMHDSGTFFVDYLSRYLIVTISSIYLLSVLFGLGYHHKIGESANMRLHLSLTDLFVSTMLFSVTINNFGLLWFGIEATTVSSALLLVIEREPLKIEAAWRYVIIVSAGLTISLVSVVTMYYAFGTLTISKIISSGGTFTELTGIAAGAALVGYGTKVGLFPMHAWLPDAHSEAPSEVSAMFSGVLLPVAIYALYRVYQATADPKITSLYLFVALLTMVFAALILPSQRFYKRMFAYSTMENMAMILIGLLAGGIGVTGAIILMVSHAFGKGGAFYSSGNILETYGTKSISQISGMREKMPYTSVSLILSSLAVTGAPPFGTFLGEFLILAALYASGYTIPFILALVSLFIAFASINFHVSRMVFSGRSEKRDEPSVLQRAVAIFSSVVPLIIPVIFVLGGMI